MQEFSCDFFGGIFVRVLAIFHEVSISIVCNFYVGVTHERLDVFCVFIFLNKFAAPDSAADNTANISASSCSSPFTFSRTTRPASSRRGFQALTAKLLSASGLPLAVGKTRSSGTLRAFGPPLENHVCDKSRNVHRPSSGP